MFAHSIAKCVSRASAPKSEAVWSKAVWRVSHLLQPPHLLTLALSLLLSQPQLCLLLCLPHQPFPAPAPPSPLPPPCPPQPPPSQSDKGSSSTPHCFTSAEQPASTTCRAFPSGLVCLLLCLCQLQLQPLTTSFDACLLLQHENNPRIRGIIHTNTSWIMQIAIWTEGQSKEYSYLENRPTLVTQSRHLVAVSIHLRDFTDSVDKSLLLLPTAWIVMLG